MSNATEATVTIAARWAARIRNKHTRHHSTLTKSVMLLSCAYKANEFIMRHHCVEAGAELVFANIPFPLASIEDVLTGLEEGLKQHRPRFVLLEHICSQPAMLLPLKKMVALCREYGVEEVAVDGAHSFGSVPGLDIPSYGADYFYR